jgi:hypothetical protein
VFARIAASVELKVWGLFPPQGRDPGGCRCRHRPCPRAALDGHFLKGMHGTTSAFGVGHQSAVLHGEAAPRQGMAGARTRRMIPIARIDETVEDHAEPPPGRAQCRGVGRNRPDDRQGRFQRWSARRLRQIHHPQASHRPEQGGDIRMGVRRRPHGRRQPARVGIATRTITCAHRPSHADSVKVCEGLRLHATIASTKTHLQYSLKGSEVGQPLLCSQSPQHDAEN